MEESFVLLGEVDIIFQNKREYFEKEEWNLWLENSFGQIMSDEYEKWSIHGTKIY